MINSLEQNHLQFIKIGTMIFLEKMTSVSWIKKIGLVFRLVLMDTPNKYLDMVVVIIVLLIVIRKNNSDQ